MISFRYHLVSIVAVFLALALGVVMGTTVIKQGVIDSLRGQAEGAIASTRDLQDQVKQLQTSLSTWNEFGKAAQGMLVSGRLAGDEVVIVTQHGVDPSEVEGVRNVLGDAGQAGARVVALIEVTPRMGLGDERAQADLAGIVGDSASTPSGDLAEQAARSLAVRLAAGPGPGTDPNDILGRLMQARFLALRAGNLSDVGGPNQSLVILSGGAGVPAVEPASFLVPLVTSLVQGSRPVVAAETSQSEYPFVPLLRTEPSLDGRLVTVDDADLMPGRVALVLGLRELLLSPGRGGDYGVKCGSCSLIPASPQ